MRGKHRYTPSPLLRRGITPAYAGKTCRKALEKFYTEDHPRVCGENPPPPRASCALRGSPPRMRGKPGDYAYVAVIGRITPAYAGKTQSFTRLRKHRLGSPPRMRGKRSLLRFGGQPPRITPAYAGKTAKEDAALNAGQDHPRVCGENPVSSAISYSIYGITPAYAGKTAPETAPENPAKDHPRVCGENSLPLLLSALRGGSPPRMRGKHQRRLGLLLLCRITPAYAGKTPFGPDWSVIM